MAKVQELLAHNLSLLLSERNISQKQLAADMGVSDGAVAHWVKGDNAPSIQRVVDICIKYGVSFDKMFFTYMDTTVKDAKKEQLIHNYELLNDEVKETLIDISEALISRTRNLKNKAPPESEAEKNDRPLTEADDHQEKI